MVQIYQSIIKHKLWVIIVFVCLAALCGILMLGVGQNYDMSKYLPKDSPSKIGIDILNEEYSYTGSAAVLIEDRSIVEVLHFKEQMETVDGIKRIVWLDDVTDIKMPIEMIDDQIKSNYYVDDDALMQIVFEQDDYSEETRAAISELKSLYGEDIALTGSAVDAYNNINSVSGNIMTGILIALAIVLLILLLSTNSLFEVVLFLITIGIAILLNMGTNAIFGEIAYMTFATVAILQLAISMDYSIFLLHRFELERKTEASPSKAMIKALKASFSSIVSSALTTIVGFIALVFMSYTIGMDMGLVLAKGIVFSLICVMVLLPALAVFFVKAIDKTKHKKLLPSMKKAQHVLSGRIKYVVLLLLVVLSVFSFMAQNKNEFLYSSSNGGSVEQNAINQKTQDKFGVSNNVVILVPRGDELGEYELATQLDALAYVKNIQGYYAFIDWATPQEIVPDAVSDEFISENYSRYIVNIDAPIESEKAFAAVEEIRAIVSKSFAQSYVTGASPVVYDIAEATSGDFTLVAILSIVFVGIILLLTFRSVSIPIILLFIIQTSIWINMSIPYFQGEPMIFIGYMVISAVQLGATIDYAILMTNYYQEGRKTLDKRAAGEYAADKAGASILVSALVLSAAGFVVSATFTQESMAQLGTLIGRGALLSGGITIVVLPQVLILLDKLIRKTTLTKNIFTRRKQNENETI